MLNKKVVHVSKKSRLTVRRWKSTMRGLPGFIIGNGPSVNDYDISSLLKNTFTIGINRAFKALDPTILMWQDIELWLTERATLPKLKAVKYSRNASDPRGIAYQFKLMPGPFRLPPNPMVLFGKGSTGPLAYEFVHALGCDPIVLIGFDCQYRDGVTDFYGNNNHHKPHTLPNCSRGLKWISRTSSGRTIINCSDNKYLKDRLSLDKVVKKLKPYYPETSREYFVERLFSRDTQNKQRRR
jgi:hypothetical protein